MSRLVHRMGIRIRGLLKASLGALERFLGHYNFINGVKSTFSTKHV